MRFTGIIGGFIDPRTPLLWISMTDLSRRRSWAFSGKERECIISFVDLLVGLAARTYVSRLCAALGYLVPTNV
jgi:hypothetical protein